MKKNLDYILAITLVLTVVFITGCKKESLMSFSANSAEQEFKSLPELYWLVSDNKLHNEINFISRYSGAVGDVNNYLFYRESGGAETELIAYYKTSFVKGLGDICCIGSYGGAVLPGGIHLEVYHKTDGFLLRSPKDTLLFYNVKSDGNFDVFIQFASLGSCLKNLNSRYQRINDDSLKFYYGRYSLMNKTLTMD